jgi:hypothetical protein
MPKYLGDVRCWVNSGSNSDIVKPTRLTHNGHPACMGMGYDKVYSVGGFKDWTGAVEKV